MSLPCLTAAPDGLFLQVVVQPRASKTAIVGLQGEELKVRLTSPPVEGAANKLCCEFFAKLCRVAKSQVSLASGDKSRHKRLHISGMGVGEMEALLSEYL